MLNYTSAALVSLLFSFSLVSAAKTADSAVELHPATASQTVEISLARSPRSPFHRGSGRIDYKEISLAQSSHLIFHRGSGRIDYRTIS
jgi:hypothetical protein